MNPQTTTVTTVTTKKKRAPRKRRSKPTTQLTSTSVLTNAASFAPTAIQRSRPTGSPSVKNSKEGCTITHREYLFDVQRTNNNFVVDTVIVNPGVSNSFPWLAQIAGRYESYTFERLDYIFQPMVPTTQAGTVMMAIDFDAADAAPNNKQTLMAFAGANRAAPWQPFRISASRIDRKKMVSERYVRSATIADTDIKTYDMGNLFIATVGTGSATVTLGELYVEYTVRFRTPQIQQSPALNMRSRTTQSGTFTLSAADQISSNIATVLGEGNQAVTLATGILREIVINPNCDAFCMSIRGRPTGNWGSNYSTLFRTINVAGGGSVFGYPSVLSNRLWRVARIANMFTQTAVQGTTNTFVDNYVFYKDKAWEQGSQLIGTTSNIVLAFRNTIVTTGTVEVDYTIMPVPTEHAILQNAPFTEGVQDYTPSTTALNFRFPTNALVLPSRESEYNDGLNKITFGKVVLPDLPLKK